MQFLNALSDKTRVGITALICAFAALVSWIVTGFEFSSAAAATFLRLSVVLGALYWSLPKPGEKVAFSKIGPAIAVLAVLIILTRKSILLFLPIAAVVGFALFLMTPKKPRPHTHRS